MILLELLKIAVEEPPFDLVITDIMMPDVDGYQVISEAKHRYEHTIVIAMCGVPDKLEMSICLVADFTLEKPFELKALKDFINKKFS